MQKMYNIEVDTHVHSAICEHAYSTIGENLSYAGKIGLKGIAITDHGPKLSPFDNSLHFYNLDIIPRVVDGVRFIRGAEVNILNKEGHLDLSNGFLKRLEWVLAGFHGTFDVEVDEELVTSGYLNALKNPYVDCLSHIGQPKFKCDYELVVNGAKEHGKVIEINNNSFHIRPGSEENCLEVAKLCKEKGVYITVSSDAHFHTMIGDCTNAFGILKKVNFPKELILNRTLESFENYLLEKRSRL